MGRISFDYSKLSGKIKEKFGSQKAYAKALGISEATLSNKLTGLSYFSQKEIRRSVILLSIDPGSVADYFFTEKVEKTKRLGVKQ